MIALYTPKYEKSQNQVRKEENEKEVIIMKHNKSR